MRSQVWFAIPSASIERSRETLPAWREMGYRVAVLQNRERGEIPADITLWSDTYPGWAASVNFLCRAVVPGDAPIIVTGGDDMLPDPARPAHAIAEDFLDRFPHTFGVMQPIGDPYMNAAEYCGSPWLGRAWIHNAYRGIGPMWPEYRHNWADHELHCVAGALGALWQRPDLRHEHRHFARQGREAPEYWRQQVEPHDRADVERFVGRLLTGFPGHEPIGGPSIPAHRWRAEYRGPALRYWASRYAGDLLNTDAADRLRTALRRVADQGAKRIGIYGAGTELRAAGDALREPPVEITCLIDDDPRVAGSRLWGFEIVSLAHAGTLGVDTVLICARAASEQMAQRARATLGGKVRVLSMNDRAEQENSNAA